MGEATHSWSKCVCVCVCVRVIHVYVNYYCTM